MDLSNINDSTAYQPFFNLFKSEKTIALFVKRIVILSVSLNLFFLFSDALSNLNNV